MRQYGNVDPWTSAGILGLMAVAGGLSVFLVFAGASPERPEKASRWPACLLPSCGSRLEFVRTHLPYIGFPWNLTGYAAGESLALFQITTVTGIYGFLF